MTPRVEPLPIAEAQAAADRIGLPRHFADLSVFRVALRSPNVAAGLHGMLDRLLINGTFDARLRELVIMRLGWGSGSVYEWTQHWRVATLLGVDSDDLLAVRDWPSSDRFDETDLAVLKATDDVLSTGVISDEAWAGCAAAFDDAQLVELVAVIANWRLFATLLESLGVPLEDGVEEWPPDGHSPNA